MTKLRLFSNLGLLTVFLAACSPGTSTAVPARAEVVEPTATIAPVMPVSPADTLVATQASAVTAIPVATSRGPELHATDPTTVRLASGGLQLVEFFRFT